MAHPTFPSTVSEAIQLQRELAQKLQFPPLQNPPNWVAGVDISQSKQGRAYYAIVVLEYSTMQEVERVAGSGELTWPYIPGLLAFREIPLLLEGFQQLHHKVEVILCDGHGISHPRSLGIASHLGVLLGIPTIGCAKKVLVGTFDPVGEEVGSKSALRHKGKLVGYAYRSRKRCRPIFISPGHLINLQSALCVVEHCLRGYKLPEPTRLAHLYANRKRKEEEGLC